MFLPSWVTLPPVVVILTVMQYRSPKSPINNPKQEVRDASWDCKPPGSAAVGPARVTTHSFKRLYAASVYDGTAPCASLYSETTGFGYC